MVSGGMTCVKYLLFCFNLLFAISGIAILTVGAVIQSAYYRYSDFVDASYVTPPMILIVVGVIVFIVAFFGCCGAVRENHCMVLTFSIFLIVIFVLELAVGIAGYMRRGEVETMLKSEFNESMQQYNKDQEMQRSWDALQHDLKCCGIKGPHDWEAIFKNNTLPYTCCRDMTKTSTDKCNTNSPSVVTSGCLLELKAVVETNMLVLGGVGVGIAVVQFLGVIFACCLARSIRREYETV